MHFAGFMRTVENTGPRQTACEAAVPRDAGVSRRAGQGPSEMSQPGPMDLATQPAAV
jgi:hypothetical protein